MLDERLIQLLRHNTAFDGWPLEILLGDREKFFVFLQERWPKFLDRIAAEKKPTVEEDSKPYGMAIVGPVDLPFDHQDVRVYIDNLFLEGLLQPVPHKSAGNLSKTWVGIGIRTDPSENRSCRLTKLIETLQASIPAEDARYGEWLHFGRGWAELVLLSNERNDRISETARQGIKNLQSQVDSAFTTWISKRYVGLVNLPPVPPVMLHHVPRFLAREVVEDRKKKIALLVVDGLSLDQWLVMREAIATRQADFRFREQAVFAWIPTITSVSTAGCFCRKAAHFLSQQHSHYRQRAWAVGTVLGRPGPHT